MNQKEIRRETFEGLCKIQCSTEEICSVLGITRQTLTSWVKAVYGKRLELVMADFQAEGKASFRRMGIKLAEKNPAVWIFLAKNWLGMSDNPSPQASGEESRELAKAITSATKSLAKMDIASLAQIPEGGD